MRWFVVGGAVILAYDAVLALGSRPLGYAYGQWWPGIVGSAAILAASAFMAARDRGTRLAGATTAAGVAVVDVFIGWPISGAIIPGYFPGGTPSDVISTLLGVGLLGAAVGAAIGFVAGALGVRRHKARTVPTS